MSAPVKPKPSSGRPSSEPNADGSTSRGAWMALVAALLGWLFDGAEMGVFSLVGRAAVQNLLGYEGVLAGARKDEVTLYFNVIIAVFLVGAATGGVLFGWLGYRIGRVRAMSLSVLTYALFTGFCGLAQTPVQLAVLRFIASLGMGGEWALGVALVMEVWPNRSRAFMAGLIGAAANFGYLLVGFIGIGLNHFLTTDAPAVFRATGFSPETIGMLTSYQGWRLMMMLGTLPALLTFFFRIFVPESHKWEEQKAKGGTSHWMSIDLLGVLVGALGPGLIVFVWATPGMSGIVRVVGTLVGIAVAVGGYTYPVYRYLVRAGASDGTSPWPTIRKMLLGACLSGVALLGTWGSTQSAPSWAATLTENTSVQNAREYTLIVLSIGAIVGTILAALAGDWFGRRITYFGMCILSLVAAVILFQTHNSYGNSFLIWSFLAGVSTASFYGWLPLYLPELFATRIRATGQGFAFNFGRIIAAIGTLQFAALLPKFSNIETYAGLRGGIPVVCSLMCGVYFFGMVIIWFAPETKGKPLPE